MDAGRSTPTCSPDPPRPFTLELTHSRGDVDGFVQIPTGGAPGTTSGDRPTLGEIGMHRSGSLEAKLGYRRGRSRFYVGGRSLELSGTAVLERDLTSNGEFFPAGTHVDSSLQLNSYRIGYQRTYAWSSALLLSPGVEYDLLDFAYTLTADEASGDADRAFRHGALRIGGGAEWPVTARLSLYGSAFLPVPLGSGTNAEVTSAELGLDYALFTTERIKGRARLGVAWDHIEFEDSQTVPNHIDVDFGPRLVFGVGFGL